MFRLVCLVACVAACSAASLPVGQQTADGSANNQDAFCEINNQKIKPGQRQAQGGFVYECQLSDAGIAVRIVACQDDNGGEHPFGDRWAHGQSPFRFILECSKDAQGVTRRSVVQCFYDSAEGQAKIEPDSEQRVGKYTVKCLRRPGAGLEYKLLSVQNDTPNVAVSSGTSSSSNTNTESKTGSTNTASGSGSVVGSSSNTNVGGGSSRQAPTCTVNNQELAVGQRSRTKSFVYECQATASSARAMIVACLDDNNPRGEHPIGDRWVEGDKPFKYVFECRKNGDMTEMRPVQCYYDSDEGQAKLDVGSQQTVGKYVVQCNKNGNNGVQFHLAFTDAYLASLKSGTATSK